MNARKYYVTTPIYYPSDYLHIGHCYCTIAADIIARYKRLSGYDTFFLTGTDEHGEKIYKKASEAGKTPKEYVDTIVEATKKLWERLDINYDYFIRTTDEYHKKRVQNIFKSLYDKNYIYKGLYKGLYCVSDEAFFTENQAEKKGGKFYCPDCEKELEYREEECYYLKISQYGNWLIEYYKEHTHFLEPKERVNEMLNNFLIPGLEDLAVTRKNMKWGIPVPFDEEHTIYVWIDALSNYITALGYTDTLSEDNFHKFWPADVHFVGKEIVRFHAIIWPIVLKMLDIPLPKKIFGHGWILFNDGKKMSKSRGNIIEPNILIDKYGSDSLRYFLMKDIIFGQDGNYTQEVFLKRINSDLANDYGNLWHRITTMLDRYFNSILPEEVESAYEEDEKELKKAVLTLDANVEYALDSFKFSEALTYIWDVIRMINKYVENSKPWDMYKDESKKDNLSNVMYISFQSFFIVTVFLQIFFTETPKKVFRRLSLPDRIPLDYVKTWGTLSSNIKIEKGDPLFKRHDIDAEIGKDTKLNNIEEKHKVKNDDDVNIHKEDIEYDDFDKIEIVTAHVITAERVENTDKLIKFVLDIGEKENRVVVSGIAEFYDPKDLIGKTVLYLANLKAKKIKGIKSQGMILFAEKCDSLSVISPLKDMPSGSIVK